MGFWATPTSIILDIILCGCGTRCCREFLGCLQTSPKEACLRLRVCGIDKTSELLGRLGYLRNISRRITFLRGHRGRETGNVQHVAETYNSMRACFVSPMLERVELMISIPQLPSHSQRHAILLPDSPNSR
jgi:hypothetical protein